MSDPKPALFPETPEVPKPLGSEFMLQNEWSMSPQIGKLAEALAKAQAKFDPVLKDSENPAFRSKYADLATVIEATRKHLASEGIAVIQMPHARLDAEESTLRLTTLMVHSSGEWIHSELSLPAMMRERLDSQTVGSAITYARRYALSAMTGVAQEDDDGNKATGIGSKAAAQDVAKRKIKESAGDPIVELVPYKEGTYVLRGHGVALVKAEMSDEDKLKCVFKYDRDVNAWTIREADGNMFASLCEKYKVPVKWLEPSA